MRVIFLAKNKPAAVKALRFLIEQSVTVAAVVAPEEEGLGGVRLQDSARKFGLTVVSDNDIYRALSSPGSVQNNWLCFREIDLVISFLFWKRIRQPLIELAKKGCINFHPAPLPEYRGLGAYTFGILNGESEWGVTAHYVDDGFDTGDVIRVDRFPIDPTTVTAFTLEQTSQYYLLNQFEDIMRQLLASAPLPRTPQINGNYYSRQDAEAERRIQPTDTSDIVDRRIRAFWYPPYGGATIEISGQEYVVIGRSIIEAIGRKFHG